ncbi:hypothetical protein GGR57DRAFT_506201 [Xylariaceae sp. FL1272]|nr:hypothetical protein GGR57DRAFT_506201 [Xylariaceae sp. FL1272]
MPLDIKTMIQVSSPYTRAREAEPPLEPRITDPHTDANKGAVGTVSEGDFVPQTQHDVVKFPVSPCSEPKLGFRGKSDDWRCHIRSTAETYHLRKEGHDEVDEKFVVIGSYYSKFRSGEPFKTLWNIPFVDKTMSEVFEGFPHHPSVADSLVDALPQIGTLFEKSVETRLPKNNGLLLVALRYIHQESLDVPAYTVVLPWPRKPPWLKQIRGSSNTHKNSTINSLINLLSVHQRFGTTQNIYARMANTMDTASHWSFDPISLPGWVKTCDPEANHVENGPSITFDAFTYIPNSFQCASAASFALSPKRSYEDMLVEEDPETVHRMKYHKRHKNDGSSQNPDMPKYKLHLSVDSGSGSTVDREMENEEATKKRFACPFLKHNQAKYGKVTTCLGSWPTIARLKEHIYRKHASDQYRCSRCLTKCENHSQLREHLRADPPCLVTTRDSLQDDKLDDLQLAEIKKKARRRTEAEKWNDIYRIIFRLSSDVEIPSPFWENITVGPTIKYHEPDTLSQFEEHLRRQLTPQNAAEIRTCLNYIQGFLQSSQGSSSSSSQSDSESGSQSASEVPFPDSDSSDGRSQPASNADPDADYASLLRGINADMPYEFELGAEALTQSFDVTFGL